MTCPVSAEAAGAASMAFKKALIERAAGAEFIGLGIAPKLMAQRYSKALMIKLIYWKIACRTPAPHVRKQYSWRPLMPGRL